MQGDHITLKKNPTYFKSGLPHLDTITFRFLPVDQSRIDALSAGELDWVDAVPLQQVPTLKNDPRFTYVTSPVAGIPDFLALNTKSAPFDNPKVRQAVALAINRADIRDVAYLGTGELGLEEVPTGSNWYDDDRYLRRRRPTSPRPSSCWPTPASPTASPSNISDCRNIPSCSRPARWCATSSSRSAST